MFEPVINVIKDIVSVLIDIGFLTFGIATVWAIIMIIQDVIKPKHRRRHERIT